MPDDNYRAAFERLWDEKSEQPVSNGKPEHAAALLSVFFAKAQDRVAIFCKELRQDVYDDLCVLAALDSAIERDVVIEVLVQNTAPEGSLFAAKIREAAIAGRKVEIHENLSGAGASAQINFAIVDDHAYRFEKNREEMQAVASAWGSLTVKLLSHLFSTLKENISHVTPVAAHAP